MEHLYFIYNSDKKKERIIEVNDSINKRRDEAPQKKTEEN